MHAILKSGKEVRGANSGRGLEVAAEDFKLGQEFDEEDDQCRHLHVYVVAGDFEFICSDEELTGIEIEEAGQALSRECRKRDTEAAKLREKLLERTEGYVGTNTESQI